MITIFQTIFLKDKQTSINVDKTWLTPHRRLLSCIDAMKLNPLHTRYQ